MNSGDLVKSVIKLSLIALLIFVLYKLKLGLLYVFIALILTLIVNPLNKLFFKKLKLSKTFSSVISITFLISFFAMIIGLIVPVLTKQGQNLSLLNNKEFRANFDSTITTINNYFENQQLSIFDFFTDLNIISDIDFSFVTQLFNSIISQIGSLSIGILSVLFITFFLLKDGNKIFENFIDFFPRKQSTKLKASFDTINILLTRYFSGVLIQVVILFVFYYTLLLILGVENSFVIAFICAILNIIPYLGPLISVILMMVLSITSNLDNIVLDNYIFNSLFIFVGFSIIQFVDNFFLQPYIFSSSVKSHPLEVFIVIIFSGILFGIFGLIIAIPLYTTLKVIFVSFFDIRKIISNLVK